MSSRNISRNVGVHGAMRVYENDVLADKYLLLDLLGAGGMGYVFRAQHMLTRVPVAIKVLYLQPGGESEHERRFQREARASMLLNHPNIVRVLDFGYHGDSAFLVMEYVPGCSLDIWLQQRGDLPTLDEAASIMLQLLSALEAAHARGIVHRDIKPPNILITSGQGALPEAKVVDFGLAHVEDKGDAGPTLTMKDIIAGTPAYMSPEQCRSLTVGHSTDIYAAGCVLTTLLQGAPPFEAESPMDLMAKQMFLSPGPLNRPPPAEPVPSLLERLRMDMLAKQANCRPETAAMAAARLREAMADDQHDQRAQYRNRDALLAGRESRLTLSETPPRPSLMPSDDPGGPTLVSISVLILQPHPNGWNESTTTGLAAQGIAVLSMADSLEGTQRGEVLVVDAADDLDGAIRAVRSRGETPTIVSVARLESEVLNRLIEAGASDVLRYPLSPDTLAKRIRRVGKRRKSS